MYSNFKRLVKLIGSNKAGFTLVELLTSIFIITLITGLFMVNYRGLDKRSSLSVVKQKLVSDIRTAQNYSLGSKTYDGTNTPAGGWGAHFDTSDTSRYIIFADGSTIDDPVGNRVYEASEAVEIKTLPAGVIISSLVDIDADGAPSNQNNLDIVFFPPDPVTYVNSNSTHNAVINLVESINNNTGAISVNFLGLIDAN